MGNAYFTSAWIAMGPSVVHVDASCMPGCVFLVVNLGMGMAQRSAYVYGCKVSVSIQVVENVMCAACREPQV